MGSHISVRVFSVAQIIGYLEQYGWRRRRIMCQQSSSCGQSWHWQANLSAFRQQEYSPLCYKGNLLSVANLSLCTLKTVILCYSEPNLLVFQALCPLFCAKVCELRNTRGWITQLHLAGYWFRDVSPHRTGSCESFARRRQASVQSKAQCSDGWRLYKCALCQSNQAICRIP